jgi:hypothetical protein
MPFYPHLDGRYPANSRIPSSKEDIAHVVNHGGRLYFALTCPFCNDATLHYHDICPVCLQLDMSNDDCWRCKLDRKKMAVDAQISLFWERNYTTMKRLGIVVTLILFTVANWRVR